MIWSMFLTTTGCLEVPPIRREPGRARVYEESAYTWQLTKVIDIGMTRSYLAGRRLGFMRKEEMSPGLCGNCRSRVRRLERTWRSL